MEDLIEKRIRLRERIRGIVMFIKNSNLQMLKYMGIIAFTLIAVGLILKPSDPSEKKWKIKITSENEPGEKLIVTGRVFERDGKTPVADAEILVYQTDANGFYREGDKRIGGIMFTNTDGGYEYHTIKPAPYPGGTNPAHVHYKVTGKDIPEQWFELQFADDKLLSKSVVEKEMKKGNFSQIQKTEKDADGVLRCNMDLMIER